MADFKDFKSLAKALSAHTQKIRKLSLSAANRAISSTRTKAVRDAAKTTGATQKLINSRFELFKATEAKPAATLVISPKPISLTAFSPKAKNVQSARGPRVGATVASPQGRKLVPAGFIANGKNGKPNVFARTSAERMPIERLTTTVVFEFIERADTVRALETKASEEFEKQIASQMKRLTLKE